jgi:GntR family transcriptional regulator
MVERVPDVAIYKQIAEQLREQILAGELAGGTLLGSEVQLAHYYEVGIGTIRRVMTLLRFDGLVVGDQGQVPRVAEAPEVQVIKVTVEEAQAMSFGTRRATAAERRQLGIPEGEWVIEVTHGGFTQLYGGDHARIVISDE